MGFVCTCYASTHTRIHAHTCTSPNPLYNMCDCATATATMPRDNGEPNANTQSFSLTQNAVLFALYIYAVCCRCSALGVNGARTNGGDLLFSLLSALVFAAVPSTAVVARRALCRTAPVYTFSI